MNSMGICNKKGCNDPAWIVEDPQDDNSVAHCEEHAERFPLDLKMRRYETVNADNCEKCGNPWWSKKSLLECTTCSHTIPKP